MKVKDSKHAVAVKDEDVDVVDEGVIDEDIRELLALAIADVA
jgi:hypothetical protein